MGMKWGLWVQHGPAELDLGGTRCLAHAHITSESTIAQPTVKKALEKEFPPFQVEIGVLVLCTSLRTNLYRKRPWLPLHRHPHSPEIDGQFLQYGWNTECALTWVTWVRSLGMTENESQSPMMTHSSPTLCP